MIIIGLNMNNILIYFAYGYPDWKHTQHHAGFDIVSNRIIEIISEYKNEINSNIKGKLCFWITGHSMGAGVANLVATDLIDRGYRDNVYCYTFAAPEPHGVNYRCIFNIVNEDDFVPEVPMSLCNWTKYGRTAKLSFNSNKSNIDTIIRNESKYSTIHYDWTNTKRFINEQYNGNTKTIEDIVSSFNSIFENNYDDMRYDAYIRNNNDYVILHASQQVIEAAMPRNVKPYQKIDTSGEDIIEYQTPAYFMQYIAYSMHGGFPLIIADSTQAGFFFASFTNKYSKTKEIVVKEKSLIVVPHYLEIYYLLTKKISITNFN